jgi:hypothetical protein
MGNGENRFLVFGFGNNPERAKTPGQKNNKGAVLTL